METLKQDAINVINKLPDSANFDEIMYRLYVLEKVRRGRAAAAKGETVSIELLEKEIETW